MVGTRLNYVIVGGPKRRYSRPHYLKEPGVLSTLTQEPQSQLLNHEADLTHYFDRFEKKEEMIRVGLESEFLGVCHKDGFALPYHGETGVHAVLKRLVSEFHYEALMEGPNIIGLRRGNLYISLEPGGQIELSAPPVCSIFEIEAQLQTFLYELRQASSELPDVKWLAFGIQPFSTLEQVSWVPKERYAIMAAYMEKHGPLSHHMMKLTATNQINLDYLSEADAMEKLRVALGITSIVSAMFAHSCFSEGSPNGWMSKRLEIWNQTDPDRSGLLPAFTQPGKTFRDYMDYVLDIPMLFIVRRKKWIAVSGLTFRQYIKKGFQNEKATLGDFELHLSTAFPEVRLKQYIEIRGADGQEPALIPSVAAFWKGILYDQEALVRAWELVAFAEVPKKGLKAKLGDNPILPIAAELVQIACASLAKQIRCRESRNECLFVDRIRQKIINNGKSPAETLLEAWRGKLGQKRENLIQYLRI